MPNFIKKPLRYQQKKNALQLEGFGKNQYIYIEHLTIVDTHKNHLVKIQADLH